MAFVPAANVIEVVPTFRNGVTLDIAKNVFNVRKVSGSVNAADLEAVSLVYSLWFGTNGNDHVSTSISLIEINTRDLTAQDSFIDTNVMSPAILGGNASPVLPMHTTLCLKFATGFAGRSRRGRLYWVGLYEGAVTGDFVAVATADAIRAALQDLAADYVVAGYELVIVSRFEEGVERAAALITPVTSISYIDLRVDTQRRRLAGEGE